MAKHLITTNELTGVRVVGGKKGTRRIGKVRRFVFHPKEKRVMGFMVKRPDLLWMFRRKDMFVAVDGYDVVDGRLVVKLEPAATDYRATCKALGVKWDDCVLWVGLPVMTEDGDNLGFVGTVMFDDRTGSVESLTTDSGATANALLGKREIPADLVKGFRRGMGAALAQTGAEGVATDEVVLGAIMVANEARDLATEGGLAEKAGEATAVVADKAQTAIDKAKPVVSNAAKVTGEVVNKGAYATGKQIAATKGMFSGFKEEYSKASGKKSPAPEAIEKSDEALAAMPAKKAPAKKTAPAQKTATAKKSPAEKPVSQKNMFSAFKEEYDKARNDD
ncbi:MAG: PRC-barrel domain-containing protein [Gordonibacter sp.]|uniref:PRC-barrel domain-containing protein n=1 Tax=Gordonibacter sp. TaxID=1968902 RepID=UPI002FC8E7D2